MRTLFAILIIFCLSGCAVTTKIIDSDGRIHIVKSKSNSKVTYESLPDGTVKIMVDNTGGMGVIQQALGLAVMKVNTNLNLSNQEGLAK